jgi:hypothetical protein
MTDIEARLQMVEAKLHALETRVNESKMYLRLEPDNEDAEYVSLVDTIVDHEARLNTLE